MSIFTVDTPLVKLQGFTFSSNITIHNPHNILAVIFELESKTQFLSIQPRIGMIMHGDKKILKLKCKPEYRYYLYRLQRDRNELIIRGSYFSQYNRKLMASKGLKGWRSISNEFQQQVLPIYFNVSQELSKINTFNTNESQRMKKVNSQPKLVLMQRIKDQKLNQDLDFIFRNEQFKKKYLFRQKAKEQQTLTPNKEQNQIVMKEINSKYEKTIKKYQNAPQKNDFALENTKQLKRRSNRGTNMRGVQLIILSIVAALFLCLGSEVGRVYRK